MKKTYLRAAVTSLALTLGAMPALSAALPDISPAVEPERHGARVGGRVFDTNREPVGGATVQLVNERGTIIQETSSDDRGAFHFRQVRPGEYVVRASKRGVGSDRELIRVRDDAVRVRLVLQ